MSTVGAEPYSSGDLYVFIPIRESIDVFEGCFRAMLRTVYTLLRGALLCSRICDAPRVSPGRLSHPSRLGNNPILCLTDASWVAGVRCE